MAETFEIKDIEEQVLLIGVSEQDGDDAEDSLVELADLVKTAGAKVVGTLIQKREKIHPGTYVGTGKVNEIAELIEETNLMKITVTSPDPIVSFKTVTAKSSKQGSSFCLK